MGKTSSLTEEEYTALYDKIAGSKDGLAFLREHAKRAARIGQSQLRATIGDLKKLFKAQSDTLQAASHLEGLRRELLEMAASIEQARREIAALQPKEAGNNRILLAANELDAIVTTTERASFDILNSAERLMETAGRLRQSGAPALLVEELEHEVTLIFTACSFQDLTGQRTSKVVNALRYVEQRVNAMISIWGMEGVRGGIIQEPVDTRPDAHLLSGPSSDGVNQDEVDALMQAAAPGAPPSPLDQSEIDNLFD